MQTQKKWKVNEPLRGKGRTIRKVWGGGGGWGKNQKKFMQGKMPGKKKSCKEEDKEKNSCRRKVQL